MLLNSTHILIDIHILPPLAHTILHKVMKCCTEKIDYLSLFFILWAKTFKNNNTGGIMLELHQNK